MKLLAIETSTERASIGLCCDDTTIVQEEITQSQHARRILPMVEALLAQAQYGLGQLDGIVFGRGPGSFTGVRIACSVAKGLAYGCDLPLYPISGLAAIADEVEINYAFEREYGILSILDARMQQLYWRYQEGDYVSKEYVTAVTDIKEAFSKPVIVAGVGHTLFPEPIGQVITMYPGARAMIRIVQRGKIPPVSAEMACPVYIRDHIVQGVNGG